MSITYNNAEVNTVTYNAAEIGTVTYNGTEVFRALTEYTFPNSEAKMTVNGDYGINVYQDNYNGSSQQGFHALDNDTTTAWIQHSAGNGWICIVFPFPIRLQAVSIINKSTLFAGTAATVNGPETGYIYVSSEAVADPTGSDETMAAMDIYAELARQQPSDSASLKGYSTTHSNPDYAGKWIRSIAIKGATWGPDGTSTWKSIGEISLVFRADAEDLSAAGLL